MAKKLLLVDMRVRCWRQARPILAGHPLRFPGARGRLLPRHPHPRGDHWPGATEKRDLAELRLAGGARPRWGEVALRAARVRSRRQAHMSFTYPQPAARRRVTAGKV